MKNKHITIVFIAFFLVILSSCNWLFPECEGRYIYKITGYEVLLYKKNPPDVGGATLIGRDNYTTSYLNFRLEIMCERIKIGATQECSYMDRDSFVNYITKADIYCDKKINDNYLANSSLNSLFADNDKNINELLNSDNKNYALYVKLLEPPLQTDTFIFNVHIELNDGKTFDLESRPIIITP